MKKRTVIVRLLLGAMVLVPASLVVAAASQAYPRYAALILLGGLGLGLAIGLFVGYRLRPPGYRTEFAARWR